MCTDTCPHCKSSIVTSDLQEAYENSVECYGLDQANLQFARCMEAGIIEGGTLYWRYCFRCMREVNPVLRSDINDVNTTNTITLDSTASPEVQDIEEALPSVY